EVDHLEVVFASRRPELGLQDPRRGQVRGVEISRRHGLAEEGHPQGQLRLLGPQLFHRREVIAQREGIGTDEDRFSLNRPWFPDADGFGRARHTKVYRSSLIAERSRAKPLRNRCRQAGISSAQAAGKASRSIRKSSKTRASIPVEAKQRRASTGEATMGSPRTLKEVLTRMGQDVRRWNASSRAAKRGATVASTVCGRAEPSTWVTAGRSRGETTRQVSSMKGEG